MRDPVPDRGNPRWVDAVTEGVLYLTLTVVTLLYGATFSDTVLAKSGTTLIAGGLIWGLVIVRSLIGETFRVPARWLVAAAGAHLLFVLLASSLARSGWLALETAMLWAVWVAVLLAVMTLSSDARRAHRIVRFVLSSAMVVSALGILQYNGMDLVGLPSRHQNAPIATMGNVNFVAHYLDLIIPLAAAFVLVSLGRYDRALAGAALAGTAVHMVLAYTRGGWLSSCAGLVAVATVVLGWRQLVWRAMLVLLCAGLLSPLASFVLQAVPSFGAADALVERTWERAVSAFDGRNFSRSMRILIWEDSVSMIAENPLGGVGPGHFGIELQEYRQSTSQRAWRELTGGIPNLPRHAHNEYLEEWGEAGILALLSLLAILGFALAVALRDACGREGRTAFDRALSAGVVGALVAASVHALFSFNLRDPVSGTYFWVLCGLSGGALTRRAGEKVWDLTAWTRGWPRLALLAVPIGFAVLSVALGVRVLRGDSLYMEGRRHLGNGHGNWAILSFRDAIAQRSYDYIYHHWLGKVSMEMGRLDEAVESLRRSLELNAHNPGAIRLLARSLFAVARPAQAVAPLQHATVIEPLNADNYHLLADALHHSGNPGGAAKVRRQGMSLRPSVQALVALGLDHRSAGDLDLAVSVLIEAEAKAPTDGVIKGNLGAVLLQAGRHDEAEQRLRVAIQRDVENRHRWQANLARSLILRGRRGDAAVILDGALAERPGDVQLLRLRQSIGGTDDGTTEPMENKWHERKRRD
ncbi:MAG: O-antigen ligase family protein [Candidatus Latescibacterota bacterium]|nr:O-antigen ligase family protein [Candidatus Latescibacterota bacterium]